MPAVTVALFSLYLYGLEGLGFKVWGLRWGLRVSLEVHKREIWGRERRCTYYGRGMFVNCKKDDNRDPHGPHTPKAPTS